MRKLHTDYLLTSSFEQYSENIQVSAFRIVYWSVWNCGMQTLRYPNALNDVLQGVLQRSDCFHLFNILK